MLLLTHTGGITRTNCFLIADESSRQAVLFDAPDHTTTPLLDEVDRHGLTLIGLWLTHGHFDHLADHAVVTQRFPAAKVLMHRLDERKIQVPQSRFIPLPFDIPPRNADAYVEDGQRLTIGSLDVEVLHTPGHSSGHVMYHFPKEKVLVGGDLIIMGAIGRTDLPDADRNQLDASIRKVMRLPGDTQLLPGHGKLSTLAEELETNPFVQSAMRFGE